MTRLKKDKLTIEVFPTREEMGEAAALDAKEYLNDILSRKDEINVVFAAAPSQNDVLASLARMDIPWNRINAWHMDEYVGLDKDDPHSFAYYLDGHIFKLVPFKSVHYIAEGGVTAEEMCENYAKELGKIHVDVVFMGVGENGHIAFNDPQFARFDDPVKVKIVELDEVCRMQQVHDGCFPTFDDVPTHAITLTIPALMEADRIFNVVPTSYKAEAVSRIVNGEITEDCPATICRLHDNATLYLDKDSAGLILK